MRRRCFGAAIVAAMLAVSVDAAAEPSSPLQVIRVGPQHPIKRIADAAKIARDGATVLIEPGEYIGDVATWPQSRLTLRAAGCCVRLTARGAVAESKAIWVIKGDDVVVEGVEMRGARVPHRNGAGIRHEGGRLVVRDSRFTGNQMGILTWNDPRAELVVERSEFDHNGIAGAPRNGDPVGHQIYVGRIARFTLRESYVHHGHYGHLVKSRARENVIEYNRLTDEDGGRASYELEFPDGGIARVVGNILQQGERTENAAIVAFGAERFFWPRNELYPVHNTLVDDHGSVLPMLRIRPGADALEIAGNLVHSRAGLSVDANLATQPRAGARDLPAAARYDFRIAPDSPLLGSARTSGANDSALRPTREYVHPRSSRPLPQAPASPGAMQSPST